MSNPSKNYSTKRDTMEQVKTEETLEINEDEFINLDFEYVEPSERSKNVRRKWFPNALTTLDKTDISYDDGDVCGNGATSIVYHGYYGTIPAAVKRIKTEYFDVYQNELALWQEMKRNSQEENVNILTLYRWVQWSDGFYYFAMELATYDLATKISAINHSAMYEDGEDYAKQDMQKLPRFMHEAAKGLRWIHSFQILHRDIKPENILIVRKTDGEEIAKLGDFGISRKLSTMSTGTNSMGKGTSDWMAPEAIQAMNFGTKFHSTKAIDIFSFGMTAQFAISLGVHPFGESKQFGKFIPLNILQENIQPASLGHWDYLADHLFQWCMEYNPNNRPNINQVVNHPFFWTPKESLGFILDVARTLYDKNDEELLELRKQIDEAYLERMIQIKQSRNWLQKMKREVQIRLFQQQSNGILKHYKGESIMMLVELIRDKYMHFTDLHPFLLSNQYFGVKGNFSDERYAKYFFTTYPDLVLFLFSFLATEKSQCLETLRREYFTHFENIPLIADSA